MVAAKSKPITKSVTKKKPEAKATTNAKPIKAPKPSAMSILKVGDKAPAFKLQDDMGKTVTLEDFKGKKLVLYFYPKDNTPGCTQEACDFNEGLAKIKKAGAEVVGVSADSIAAHQKFKTKYNLGFRLLSDESKVMLESYGVWQEKSLYGRKFMGIVRSTFIIDEKGKIQMIFPKVKVAEHFEEVLQAL